MRSFFGVTAWPMAAAYLEALELRSLAAGEHVLHSMSPIYDTVIATPGYAPRAVRSVGLPSGRGRVLRRTRVGWSVQ